MTAYYNEIDPYAAQWLRNLIAAGHIAPGVVDERSISDIRPDDLRGFSQCHFFAGIGVWSHALRRAGWSDDTEVWTGSCPCQPFSTAGAGGGFSDERHLWPHFHWLIDQCRPAIVLGEQVASKDGLAWLDLVSTDLEGTDYAFGASDLCAAGFSGAHIRQRLYWVGVADTYSERLSGKHSLLFGQKPGRLAQDSMETSRSSETRGVADSYSWKCDWITASEGCQHDREAPGRVEGYGKPESGSAGSTTGAPMLGRYAVDWLYCRDDKWRPVGPGTFPLVDETPARVGRLRAYGNALDAETATEFCIAVAESLSDIVAVDRDHVLTDTDSPFG